jgi:hypothetical protein
VKLEGQGPARAVTLFVCVHCTQTRHLSSQGLFLSAQPSNCTSGGGTSIPGTYLPYAIRNRPGRFNRSNKRKTESGTDLNTILRCFISLKTVVTSRNNLVFKIKISPAGKWLSESGP